MRKKIKNKKRHVVVVGVDLSLTSPGICVGRSRINYQCESFQPPGPNKFPSHQHRCNYIAEEIIKKIQPWTSPLSNLLIVMEDYAFGASGHTFAIAENGGILKYKLLHELGLPPASLVVVSPGQLKKYVSGNGNASKALMMKEVFKRWSYDAADDDEADAFGLFMIGLGLKDISPCQNAKQEEVLKTVKERNQT